jgi:F0F1-type ATP synthase membrane subunit b/b'
MQKKWILLAVMIINSQNVFSAGGNGHGSVSDLIAPSVNVFILLSVLVWKLKKPMFDMFIKKSEEISNTLERASLKSKEAEMMYENEIRKQNNLSSEIKQIQNQTAIDIQNFEKKFSKEIEDKTHKLKSDATIKINAEKKQMISELNNILLDQVISKAKLTIRNNKEFQDKTSTKLLKGIQ